jgi:hypothetical protein
MGPASDPDHALVVFGVIGIGLVAIRLKDALIIGEEGVQLPVATRQAPVEDDVAPGSADDPQPALRRRSLLFIGIVAADRGFISLEVAARRRLVSIRR